MTKLCSNCGIEETDELQLKKCTGCNSSKILYCSRQCQKSAWKIHKKRCRRKANSADQLIIDNEKISNCDLILNYASRFMKNLKHIEITFQEKYELVVSHNVLRSFLQTVGGTLESLHWSTKHHNNLQICKVMTNDGKLWMELHGLKVLHMNDPIFTNCQDLVRVIEQQKESILSLNLVHIALGAQDTRSWLRNDCTALVTSVSQCKHLVQLNLNQHHLRDSDIEIMLPCLPNLEILYMCGPYKEHGYAGGNLTDKSCKSISRCCRQLKKLDIGCQRKITVAGVKRILKGCQQLRVFDNSIEMQPKDYISLLRMAPQFMIKLDIRTIYDAATYIDLIEETNGQFVFDYLHHRYNYTLFDIEELSEGTYIRYKERQDMLSRYENETNLR